MSYFVAFSVINIDCHFIVHVSPEPLSVIGLTEWVANGKQLERLAFLLEEYGIGQLENGVSILNYYGLDGITFLSTFQTMDEILMHLSWRYN